MLYSHVWYICSRLQPPSGLEDSNDFGFLARHPLSTILPFISISFTFRIASRLLHCWLWPIEYPLRLFVFVLLVPFFHTLERIFPARVCANKDGRKVRVPLEAKPARGKKNISLCLS
jgi:hypothetical protein